MIYLQMTNILIVYSNCKVSNIPNSDISSSHNTLTNFIRMCNSFTKLYNKYVSVEYVKYCDEDIEIGFKILYDIVCLTNESCQYLQRSIIIIKYCKYSIKKKQIIKKVGMFLEVVLNNLFIQQTVSMEIIRQKVV